MTEDQNADYKISSLEGQASDLQKSGLLTNVRDLLEDVDAKLSGLPAKLAEMRSKGYVFKSYLEEQAKALKADWPSLKARVQSEIDSRVRDLEGDLRRAEQAVRTLQPYKGRSLSAAQAAINRVQSDLDSAERRVRAANDAATGMFDAKQRDVDQVDAEVRRCLEMLGWADKASFGFHPGEALVEVVNAKWLKDGRGEGPKGILFLTDQRILFEQREKVATKKVLFITTASQEVQQLQWEAPLGTLQEAAASEQRKALILKKEHLTLQFKPSATVREVLMELDADSEGWRALINRVLSGDINKERVAGAAEAAAQEAAIEVPSKCPSCGATLDISVVKGMTAVKCTYCGTNIPLTRKA